MMGKREEDLRKRYALSLNWNRDGVMHSESDDDEVVVVVAAAAAADDDDELV